MKIAAPKAEYFLFALYTSSWNTCFKKKEKKEKSARLSPDGLSLGGV